MGSFPVDVGFFNDGMNVTPMFRQTLGDIIFEFEGKTIEEGDRAFLNHFSAKRIPAGINMIYSFGDK